MELAESRADPAERPRTWVWAGVLLPFLASRAGLFVVAWASRIFPSNVEFGRGWSAFPQRAIDAWARWDSRWYLEIALQGYERGALAPEAQHNVAFFPAYPMLIRALHAALPASLQGLRAATVIAIVLANLLAVGALALVYAYARDRLGESAGAERAVVYLLAFPSAFFLSAALTESLFLFLAAAALLAARRGRWALCGAAGYALGLTRPNGFTLMVPLAWIYLEQRAWRWREIRWDALAILLPAAGLASYALYLGAHNGDPLAMFHVSASWERGFAWPWRTLFASRGHALVDVDRAAALAFLAAGLAMVAVPRWRADGLVVLCIVAPFLFSGRLMSAVRYVLAAFPAFVFLASIARSRLAERSLVLAGVAIQAALFLAWTIEVWIA